MRKATTPDKIREFMKRIGAGSQSPGRVYLTGGATALLHGWRETTIDIDLKFDPEPQGVFQLLPKIKEELQVNIELASPDQFLPPLKNWQERSIYIDRFGEVEFYHYDLYSQALSKIERGHSQDIVDVDNMVKSDLVQCDRLLKLYREINSELIRYPSIDPADLDRKVSKALKRLKSWKVSR